MSVVEMAMGPQLPDPLDQQRSTCVHYTIMAVKVLGINTHCNIVKETECPPVEEGLNPTASEGLMQDFKGPNAQHEETHRVENYNAKPFLYCG